ncbi:lysine--tRNA ligase [bacterium]|nr:lysine--tRNA ligase [bacterium]
MSQDKEESHLIEERRKKLAELREANKAFPNDFKRKHLAQELKNEFDEFSKEELEKKKAKGVVAGRIMLRRMMGKASFTTIQDFSGRIQLYIRADEVANYNEFKNYDLGDIIGAEGTVFKTNTGELSIHVKKLKLLTKSLRPLPEKHLGLTDTEIRYRKRYLDLLTNPESLEVFKTRAEIISNIRNFLLADNFIEVETPMMHPIPGGATARPFVTHHNSLNMDLFLRVAPELYLKRLVVGGFEKVFEINRNFRNEGLSTRHNPEFTMLEFYTAYVDSDFQIKFVEKMFKAITKSLPQKTNIFKKAFHKLTMDEAILQFTSLKKKDLKDAKKLKEFCNAEKIKTDAKGSLAIIKNEIFEALVEEKLIEPTFITEYPIEVSPLARASTVNPEVAERFELFIDGKEIANGFSELNDPEEQAERFKDQVAKKDSGDNEAMHFDKDYIEALEHGLAPCAGVGIGIDRLTMLITGTESIRDVLLFPQLKNK